MFSTPPPQHRHRHSSHFPAPVNDVKCAELWGLFSQSITPVINPSCFPPQAPTPSPRLRPAEVSVPASPHLHSPL